LGAEESRFQILDVRQNTHRHCSTTRMPASP